MVILRISATYGAHPQSATKSYVTHNHTFADPAKAADFGTDWLCEEAVWFPIGAPSRGEHLINASFVMYSTHSDEEGNLVRDGIIFREHKDFAWRF